MHIFLLTYPFAPNTAESSPMSWLQFVEAMTGHLAWPLVMIMLAFALRKYWGALPSRLD